MNWIEDNGYDGYGPDDWDDYDKPHTFKFTRLIHETPKARLFEFASVGTRWVPKRASRLNSRKHEITVIQSIWIKWLDEKPVGTGTF